MSMLVISCVTNSFLSNGISEFHKGDYVKALSYFESSQTDNNDAYLYEIKSLILLDRKEEASTKLDNLEQVTNWTINQKLELARLFFWKSKYLK